MEPGTTAPRDAEMSPDHDKPHDVQSNVGTEYLNSIYPSVRSPDGYDSNGLPFWRGRHGQFTSQKAADESYTDVATEAKVIPIIQHKDTTPMVLTPMSLNPDDAASTSRFFQSIADSIVNASKFAKELEELRTQFEGLKKEIEVYREHNARLDDEVNSLRKERVELQRENAMVREELDQIRKDYVNTIDRLSASNREADHWQSQFIQLSTVHDTVRRDRDDAQIRVMELEDKIKALELDRDGWMENAKTLARRLESIHTALTSPVPQLTHQAA